MPTSLGPAEILVILVVALIVLGPKRLPEAGRQVGKALAEVRRWSQGVQTEIRSAIDVEPGPSPLPPSAPVPPSPVVEAGPNPLPPPAPTPPPTTVEPESSAPAPTTISIDPSEPPAPDAPRP
ncbi:MAG: Sec-independent protein translocase subunit TatA/TatB [Acidimicrobiales bacterium]